MATSFGLGKWISKIICVILLILFFQGISSETVWPQPHKQYPSRPPTGAPYCQAGVIPFCPTGLKDNYMPTFGLADTIYVYAMKAPVWEFKFGSLLKKFNIMHDAIGFHHVQSGLNFTMEWYELYQLFNCTFPHIPTPNTLKWCNQGATCIYLGIDEKHWKENGTLVKVSTITGATFNQFANWTEYDNNTYPFYETWTVLEKPGSDRVWFNPFDCASWVLRAFQKLHEFGANFDQSVHLNYTKINLYSQEPVLIGNTTTIYQDPKILADLTRFYSNFQKGSLVQVLEHLLTYIIQFITDDAFYLFYNDEYWLLRLQAPFIKHTYDEVPLPS